MLSHLHHLRFRVVCNADRTSLVASKRSASTLIDLRIERGLSQRLLAKRAGMQQPVIARLKGGKTASLRTLKRVADALDAEVRVTLIPRQAASDRASKRHT